MEFLELLKTWFPVLGTLAGVATAMVLVSVIMRRSNSRSGFSGQLVLIALTLVAVIVLIAVLPVESAMRGQLFGLLGVILSAAIALSSTTFIGNAMAGLMLRSLGNFRPGDFVRVGDQIGRVSERGLFHTELQTEDSDLTTLPNLYLVTNPVTVVRAAGTVVSTQVSLGYDVSRLRVERALLLAAERAELSGGFVQVVELGDFSVVYRVAGLLEEITTLLSAKSWLRACVLDALHEADVEIVSPTFMNTRSLSPETRFLPPEEDTSSSPPASAAPDAVVFEKARQAAATEELRDKVEELARRRKQLEASAREATTAEERAALEREAEALKQQQETLGETIEQREARRDESEST